jgi:hypothetical protein
MENEAVAKANTINHKATTTSCYRISIPEEISV